ncbi:hypothetical protein ACO0LO_09850 [Undibacterium sp. TJN25]|uniref:hypothetical protein n=1 Tax=Undibacterium sp. TJN25 TaxID=3413056 RepID=UPI003BF1ABC8
MRQFLIGFALVAALGWVLFAGNTSNSAAQDAMASVTKSPVISQDSSLSQATNKSIADANKEIFTPSEDRILQLKERADLMGKVQADGSIFLSQNWTPPPPPPPPLPLPPPPAAPSLPFTFIGKKFEDGKWEIYLAQGDQTYITTENSTIAGIYRIDKIQPPTMTFTYIPMNQIQTLQIGGGD